MEYRPCAELRGQIFLGDEGFAREMQARIDARADAPEVPRPQRIPARPGLGRIASKVCALTGAAEESLRRQQRSDVRLLVSRLGRRFHDPHREIGAVLGIGRAAAGRLHDEAERRAATDPAFSRLFDRCLSALQSKP